MVYLQITLKIYRAIFGWPRAPGGRQSGDLRITGSPS